MPCQRSCVSPTSQRRMETQGAEAWGWGADPSRPLLQELVLFNKHVSVGLVCTTIPGTPVALGVVTEPCHRAVLALQRGKGTTASPPPLARCLLGLLSSENLKCKLVLLFWESVGEREGSSG